jgi:CTP:molybdopterin cytidylyltransferase MocA/uncharacterized membrane protein (DUF485 family)
MRDAAVEGDARGARTAAGRVIAALVLAAGAGRRFGHEGKLLQDLEGAPIIRRAVEAVYAAGVDDVIVVVGAEHGNIAQALNGTVARLVTNDRASEGMGTSIAAGIAALSPQTQAVLITLGDIPRVPAVVIPLLRQRYEAGGAEIVVPAFHGTGGHPVLFARSVFAELAALTGDRGARAVIDRVPGRVAVVPIDIPPPMDVDTVEDLARVRGTAHHTSTPMHNTPEDVATRIRALAAARWRIAITLTVVMIVIYFGFIGLIAFNRDFLAQRIGRGLSLGILLGALVIVASWLLTWVYVRWANRHYDVALDAIGRDEAGRR